MQLPFPLTISDVSTLLRVSKQIGVPASWLFSLIGFESRWNPKIANPNSTAKGLIQFIDSVAKELGYSSSADLVTKNPTISTQLNGPVLQYFLKRGPYKNFEDFCAAVLYPAARSMPIDSPLPLTVQKVNPGVVTMRDYANKVRARGLQYGVELASFDAGLAVLIVVIAAIGVKIVLDIVE